jgi:hypothetical protein
METTLPITRILSPRLLAKVTQSKSHLNHDQKFFTVCNMERRGEAIIYQPLYFGGPNSNIASMSSYTSYLSFPWKFIQSPKLQDITSN